MPKFIVVLVLALAAVVLAGEGKKGKKMPEMKCKGEAFKGGKDMFKTKQECYKKYYPKDEDKKNWKENMKNTCISVCQMKKEGLLKEDGTYDADAAKTKLEAVFPSNVHEAIVKAMNECAETNKDKMDNKEDNNCESYKPFVECKFKKMFEICEWKKAKAADSSSESAE